MSEVLPRLTSRFLFLFEDEEDATGLESKQVRTGATAVSRLEETKEPEEPPPVFISPCTNHVDGCGVNFDQSKNSPLWSSLTNFETNCGLPSCSVPIPDTPLSTKAIGGLFASFSSSPLSQDMWQYGECYQKAAAGQQPHHSPFLSPRSTDAVFQENQKAAAMWCNKNNRNKKIEATIPNFPPMAPSLQIGRHEDIPSGSNHNLLKPPRHAHAHSDGTPLIIFYRTRSSSSTLFEFDDDEVSVLADDPDEDDAGVLPPATYDVVVNILDEIDRDGAENAAGIRD